MTSITKGQFREQLKGGVATNDAAVQKRLDGAGVDGKKLLEGADTNRDGRVQGQAEVDGLWNQIDDLDKDGSRETVTGAKPRGVVSALSSAPQPKVEGNVADIYAAETAPLARGAQGKDVQDAQKKLIGAGFALPQHGADGKFGPETEQAVKRFQAGNKLPETGQLDDGTLARLNTAKPTTTTQQAPSTTTPTTTPKTTTTTTTTTTAAPDAAKVQFPEYGKMFKDGVLSTTVGVGFDEDGNDIGMRRELVDGLNERGFKKLDVKNLTDEQLKQKGFDPTTIDRNATYFTKPFQHEGKPVQSLVKLVDRNTPDAKGQFANGMSKDDMVIYSGHARYGSGPDFDHKDSKAGNFVIGKPYEAGHVAIGANDLAKTKLKDGYQLMLFDACSSKNYVDDLRSIPRNKSAENLDIIASTRELPWSTGKSDVFSMLDGVMKGQSIQEIKTNLDRPNAEAGKGAAFTADGFRGNGYRPAR